jgi:hypothetical protein
MENKPTNFFQDLFDFSFKRLITTKIIPVVFAICMFLVVVAIIFMIVTSFMSSVVTGVIMLLLSPVIFAIEIIWIRMLLEMIIVLFSIKDELKEIKEMKKSM